MSSAKAALESDTKVLAYEAGRKHKVGRGWVRAWDHRFRVRSGFRGVPLLCEGTG